jgi:uncharacterized protein (TIGR02118 family)
VIVLTYCMHRLPQLTHQAFIDYWGDRHAPLMRRHQGILRVTRYVQLCATQSELNLRVARFRGGPPAFDGIAEVWYDSWEAFSAAAKDPAAQVARDELLQDERRFIDLARSPVWVNEIREIY